MFFSDKLSKYFKFIIILKALWPYLWSANRKLRYRLISSIVVNFLAIIASISIPILFAHIVDSFNSSFIGKSKFLTLLVIYVGVWFFSKMFIYLREIIMFPVVERAIRLLTFDLFQHIQLLPFQYHLKRKIGEITATIEASIQSFPPIVWSIAFALGPLVIESVFVFGIVSFLCGIQYSFILATCVICYIIVTRLSLPKVVSALRKANISHLSATSRIIDSFLNFSTNKYFHAYKLEFQRADQALENREIQITDSLIKDQMIRVYQTLILTISFLSLMIFTGFNLLSNKLSLGEFIMLHAYMLQFTAPLEGFSQIFQSLNQSFIKMERALKVFKKPIESKTGTP